MVATHVLDERGRRRRPDPTAQWLAGGRASALFAVLAGVSLALMSGGTTPVAGRPLDAAAAGLAVRALLIAAARPGARRARLRAGGDPHLLRRAVPAGAAVPRAAGPAAVRARRRRGWWSAPVVSQLVRPHLPDAAVREPGVRPARAPRPAAQRAAVHRLLPVRARGSPTCWSAWRSAGWTCAAAWCRRPARRDRAGRSPWWRPRGLPRRSPSRTRCCAGCCPTRRRTATSRPATQLRRRDRDRDVRHHARPAARGRGCSSSHRTARRRSTSLRRGGSAAVRDRPLPRPRRRCCGRVASSGRSRSSSAPAR